MKHNFSIPCIPCQAHIPKNQADTGHRQDQWLGEDTHNVLCQDHKYGLVCHSDHIL